MADTFTTFLNLIKPDTVKNALISDINGNMDLVDAAVQSLDTEVQAYGVWQDYTAEIRSAVSGSAAAGSSVSVARWMKINRTVWVQVEGSTANLVSQVSIMLPAAAGTPTRRTLLTGQMACFHGSGVPAEHTGLARLTADKLRVISLSYTNAFVDSPAGATIQANIMYEVNA